MVTLPVFDPVDVGEKAISKVQDWVGARVRKLQTSLEIRNSLLLNWSAPTTRSAVPTLVSVNVFAELVDPTSCFPKKNSLWLSKTAGASPVPLSATISGEDEKLPVMVIEPVLISLYLGLKTTSKVQVFAGAMIIPLHRSLDVAKKADADKVSITRLVWPVLVIVTVCAGLVVPAS